MYQTKIASASGRYAVDTSGASLYNIGNVSLKPGDYVMTDGRCIYGRHKNQGLVDIPDIGLAYIFMAGNKLQLIPLNNLYSPYEIAIDESVEYGPESTIIMGEKTAWLMIKDERKYTFTNLLTNKINTLDFTCNDYYPVVSVRSIKDTLYVLAHESYDSLSLYVDGKKKWTHTFSKDGQGCEFSVYGQIVNNGSAICLWAHHVYSVSGTNIYYVLYNIDVNGEIDKHTICHQIEGETSHHEYRGYSVDIVLNNDIPITYYGVDGSDDDTRGGYPDLRGKICGYDFSLWAGRMKAGSAPDAYKMSDGNILLLTDSGLLLSDGKTYKKVTESSYVSTQHGLFNAQIYFWNWYDAKKALSNCVKILSNVKSD